MATLRKFRNLEEINQFLTQETKVALEETLMAMIPKLRFFIDEDIYWAYHPTFYKRTRWLKRREDVIEHYISTLQNKLRGGIRIVASRLNSVSDKEKFQHGASYRTKSGKLNTYSNLSAESFLEILNDEDFDCLFNPFGLPSLQRRSFWKDFLEWAEKHYAKIFMEKCRKHKIDLNNLGSTNNGSLLSEPPKEKRPSSEPPNTSISGTSNDIGRHAIGNNRPQGRFVNRFVKQSVLQGSSNSFMESALQQASVGQYEEMGIGTLDIKIGEQGLSGNKV